jgi:hypothetical protein
MFHLAHSGSSILTWSGAYPRLGNRTDVRPTHVSNAVPVICTTQKVFDSSDFLIQTFGCMVSGWNFACRIGERPRSTTSSIMGQERTERGALAKGSNQSRPAALCAILPRSPFEKTVCRQPSLPSQRSRASGLVLAIRLPSRFGSNNPRQIHRRSAGFRLRGIRQ